MESEKEEEKKEEVQNPCPVCGEEMAMSGHCLTCYSCGYSLCSL